MSLGPALSAALQVHGLQLRGGFCPSPEEAIALPNGRPAAVLWLAGNMGGSMWNAFQASSFAHDGLPHPLDRWSRHLGDALAQQFGGAALYPFDGPPAQPHYHPFQQWASRCEPLFPSPLMLRMHPQHGLWHAYRFALIFSTVDTQDRVALAENTGDALQEENPCLSCIEQPCLQACPVQAYDGQGFDVHACRAHVRQDANQVCMTGGCLARNACPVAPHLRYAPAQARFHMQAFVPDDLA
jgi:ferredoxin